MITVPTSQSHNADLSRWSSTRHGDARSNTSFLHQFVHQSLSIDTNSYTHSKLTMHGNAVEQCARSRSLSARSSLAAHKSP